MAQSQSMSCLSSLLTEYTGSEASRNTITGCSNTIDLRILGNLSKLARQITPRFLMKAVLELSLLLIFKLLFLRRPC